MATETKPTEEIVKMDLFEDDDDFEESELREDHYSESVFEVGMMQQWEDDWDDDDVDADFLLQLRREIDNSTQKK